MKRVKNILSNIRNDIKNFHRLNSDEEQVKKANYLSAYQGQVVIKAAMPNGRSGSFGMFMLLDKTAVFDPETIRHEWGHYVQYRKLGFMRYFLGIGLPSLLNGKVPLKAYYMQPWEITADLYGKVLRDHSLEATAVGQRYLAYLISIRGGAAWLAFGRALTGIIRHDMSVLDKRNKETGGTKE